jgi:hypothetical protein
VKAFSPSCGGEHNLAHNRGFDDGALAIAEDLLAAFAIP